jgi:hypothetical protein
MQRLICAGCSESGFSDFALTALAEVSRQSQSMTRMSADPTSERLTLTLL